MKSKILIMAIFCVSSLSCSAEVECPTRLTVSGLELIQEEDLRNIVEGYYRAEKNMAWKVAYSYRDLGFKDLVPLDKYESTMVSDSNKRCLISVRINSVKFEGDTVSLSIRFVERDADKSSSTHGTTLSFNERIVLQRYEGSWYFVSSGVRNNYFLNRKMSYN